MSPDGNMLMLLTLVCAAAQRNVRTLLKEFFVIELNSSLSLLSEMNDSMHFRNSMKTFDGERSLSFVAMSQNRGGRSRNGRCLNFCRLFSGAVVVISDSLSVITESRVNVGAKTEISLKMLSMSMRTG